MTTVLSVLGTILLGLVLFGGMILIHEGGHYCFARLFHVQVNEFSIGMGPKLLQKRSEKTGIAYSLRAFPIGGYVAMEGEDGDLGEGATEEPSIRNGEPFYRKPVWQRMIVTAAGAAMNLLLGAILTVIVAAMIPLYGSTVVANLPESSAIADSGILQGDEILSIDGNRVYNSNDLIYEVAMTMGRKVDVVVARDGQKQTLSGVRFASAEAEGHTLGMMDFQVYRAEKNFGSVVKMSLTQMRLNVKMVIDSIAGLVKGDFGVKDLSGPVGVTKAMGEAAKEDIAAAKNGTPGFELLYFCAIITVNLGIMNLLPLPALDGGRLFCQLLELIFRRPIPAKIEAIINTVGLVLLLGLMVFITGKDILSLF